MENLKLIKKSLLEVERITPKFLMFSILYSIFSSIFPLLNIIISGNLINSIVLGADKEFEIVLILISLNFIVFIFMKYMEKLKNEKRNQFLINYICKIDQKLLSVDFPDIEGNEVKNIRKYVDENTNMIGHFPSIYRLPQLVEMIFSHFATIILSIGIIITLFSDFELEIYNITTFISSPYFIMILLIYLIFSICFSVANSKKLQSKMKEFVDEMMPINRNFSFYGNLMFLPSHGCEIRIYDQSDWIAREGFEYILDKGCDITRKSTKESIKCNFKNSILNTILNILIYIFVIVKASLGIFSIGNIIQYVGIIAGFMHAVTELSARISDLFIHNHTLKKYFELIEYPSSMYKGSLPIEKRIFCDGGDADYEIDFKNVSFKYPNTENYILKNINIKFKVGGKLAVVGLNGSGKTTFIKLLTRLYDPTEGEILLNGINIKKYDYYEYMNVFSVVFQDFKLFDFTLAENVACSVDYDEEKVIEALNKAGFGERLKTLEHGIHTTRRINNYDNYGVNFSGGEMQKIALARAIYKNSPFIVLDEPTAALDPIAEYEIYSKFDNLVGEKTAVYISHRLSSCRFCEDIAVFEAGEIVERGNHTTLIERNGLYNKMWYAQAEYYDEECETTKNSKI